MKKYILIFTLPLLLAATCKRPGSICNDDSHEIFTITNNSTKRINFFIYGKYPDTSIGIDNPVQSGGINIGNSSFEGVGPISCWEDHFFITETNEYLHIFDQDTLENLDWEIIRSTGRGLIEVIEFNLDTLGNNDFNAIIIKVRV